MRRLLPLAILAVLAAVVAVDAAVALHNSRAPRVATPAAAAPTVGVALDEPLPRLPLLDDRGHATSLAAYKGRWVVLAPTLTLCHEVCPLTTAALEEVDATVRERGMSGRVAVMEASVDPWRDSPARLVAFKRMTRTPLTLLTGTRAQLRRLWRTLGGKIAYVHAGGYRSLAALEDDISTHALG